MKLSDYVASFLAEQKIKHVFAISGGASLHLIHSIAEHPGIDYICPQHEQAGAMAADAYSRVTGELGCAIATSGPGATNLITGICCAYFDSVPVLYITGQVSTFRAKGNTGVRQMGFQETEVVHICKTITKYAVLLQDPPKIKYELQKACYLARQGRPGPVLVDIPDNFQRTDIDVSKLYSFTPPPEPPPRVHLDSKIEECVALIKKAKRPVIVYGWGVHLAGAEAEARRLVNLSKFPTVLTWAASDLLPYAHPMAAGSFGTHGTRYGNFTVQNADLILSIGSRLDTKATGSPPSSFAREAKIIMVDIDPCEINKFKPLGVKIDIPVTADAKQFLTALNNRLEKEIIPEIEPWHQQIHKWKQKYPICLPRYHEEKSVNPYVFIKALSSILREEDVIFSDTGCALAWMMQAFEFKENQHFYHAFNLTPMGYGLPASIGGSLALNKKRVILITGDGSLQMNIQELITVIRHKLPVKILLLNNHGHSMVQQTQEQWLDGKYFATSVEGGLAFPDFVAVARAYGYPTETITLNSELPAKLKRIVDSDGPFFGNIEIRAEHRVIPQVRYGRPNEDGDPPLDRGEFMENMLVKPAQESLAP